MRRIRVVMLIESLARGGAENFTSALAAGLDKDRFDVTVCITRCDGDPRSRDLVPAGVRVLRLRRTGTADVAAWVPLLRLLRRERTDVLNGHMFGSNVWAAVIGRLARVPAVVATEHSWSYAGRPVRRALDGLLIGRLATAFVAVSAADARNMVEVERVPPARVRLIPTARDATPAGDGDAFRAAVGVPPGVPLVGAVAALSPAKALDVLLRGFARARERVPGMRLVIAGEGEERAALERLAGDLGIADVVAMPGHRDDVPDLLAACDAFALSSDNEGTPLAVIEAMRAGCPVVASAVGGVPDLLAGGAAGLLVPRRDADALADGLVRIVNDAGFARRLAGVACERARREYSLDRAVGRWQDLYEELAGVDGGPGA